MPDIVFDNCTLSNFALSDSLWLLEKFSSHRGHVTGFVMAENQGGIHRGHESLRAVRKAVDAGWLMEVNFQSAQERSLFEALSISLGLGEASCMAIAKERSMVFACDDRFTRKEAAALGITLTGTVGILIKAVRVSVVGTGEADILLQKMIHKGFYSPVDRLP